MDKKVILDTNAVVSLLQNNKKLIQFISTADSIKISIITQIEFLAYSNLSENDIHLFHKFVERVGVYNILSNDTLFINKIIEVRKIHKLKLPDAIIAATAIINQAILISSDQSFQKIENLQIKSF